MKKYWLFLGSALFFVLSFPCFPGPVAGADDSLLDVQVLPDQSTVKSGMMFLADAQVVNTSGDTSADFWTHSCSYEKHWVTNNTSVFIQPWTCNENTLEQVTLDPSSTYSKNLILYISKKDKSGPVSFRLGFKRMSEDGDVAEPLWSDPVTMNVVVPEALKEIAPSAPPAVSQETGPSPASAVEEDEADSVPPTNPVMPAEDPPLVFNDPAVPIKIQPGKEFSIALASNPSTGFRWKMTLPKDQENVLFLGDRHVLPEKVMPGAPGQEVYKFKAVTVGETKVDFVYERPWEPKTAPTRKIFTILVQKA